MKWVEMACSEEIVAIQSSYLPDDYKGCKRQYAKITKSKMKGEKYDLNFMQIG